MSPRWCGAARARARSRRARNRRGGSALAMVGSLVPPPRGRWALYSRRFHQLMWLLLSHSNPWHWGSAATPCPGLENSDAQTAMPTLPGSAMVETPRPVPRSPFLIGDASLPFGSSFGQSEREVMALLRFPRRGIPVLSPLLHPGCREPWSWGSPSHPPCWALLVGSWTKREPVPLCGKAPTPRSSITRTL